MPPDRFKNYSLLLIVFSGRTDLIEARFSWLEWKVPIICLLLSLDCFAEKEQIFV